MDKINALIAKELGVQVAQVAATVELLGEHGEEVHVPMRLLLDQPFAVTPMRVRS